MEGSPCILIKATAFLDDIPPQKVFDQIYDIEIRKKWDTVFDAFKKIQQIDELTDIIYFSIKVKLFSFKIKIKGSFWNNQSRFSPKKSI